MAISLQKYRDIPITNYMEFYCDLIAEIGLLPTTLNAGVGEYDIYDICALGSSCYCFEDGNVYALSSNGWVIM